MLALSLLMLAAFSSGMLNAIAGGGAFITFPALLFAGVPPVSANVTSTVALFPGQMASAWAYRGEIKGVTEVNVTGFVVVSVIGGIIGGILLLTTPDHAFAGLVPWLLLFATTVFAVGNFMPGLASRLKLSGPGVLFVQFIIAIYGGYFGGGIGFLMLAALTLFGMRDIHAMNGLRILLAALMNGAAVVAFCLSGAVSWTETVVMAVAAIAGGYAGAHGAKRVSRSFLKWVVVLIGVGLTVYFFVKGAGA